MLLLMQFRHVGEITECGMFSETLSVGRKHVKNAEFYVLYQWGNHKHKTCSTDRRPVSTYLWKGWLKECQTKWQILWFKWVFCSFVWFCYMAGWNTWSSLSEHKSVNTQNTISSIQSKVKVEVMAFRMTRCKHLVSQVPSVGPALCGIITWCAKLQIQCMANCRLSQPGTRDCKASCGVDFRERLQLTANLQIQRMANCRFSQPGTRDCKASCGVDFRERLQLSVFVTVIVVVAAAVWFWFALIPGLPLISIYWCGQAHGLIFRTCQSYGNEVSVFTTWLIVVARRGTLSVFQGQHLCNLCLELIFRTGTGTL